MYLLFCFCVKIVMGVINLKKGQVKRIWTKEQKIAIIRRYYEEHISAGSLAREYDADKGMIYRWIRNYNQYGEAAFDCKNNRKGNPFSALHTSKSLTENDRLRLQLAKLEIENERLKKGRFLYKDRESSIFCDMLLKVCRYIVFILLEY